jgi:predicted transcriptional regulator
MLPTHRYFRIAVLSISGLPPQRIIRLDPVALAKRRPRPVLERQAIQLQRNRDAADEGGVVLADHDHGIWVALG